MDIEKPFFYSLRNRQTGDRQDLVEAAKVADVIDAAAEGAFLPSQLRTYADELRDVPTLQPRPEGAP